MPPCASSLTAPVAVAVCVAASPDRDGVICGHEFEMGVRALGLDVPSEVINELFAEWDRDDSDSLTLQELTSVLHGTATIADLRAQLAKSGTRVTQFFKQLDDG
jgi:Ca2+-binding EF-hand superfamily protein